MMKHIETSYNIYIYIYIALRSFKIIKYFFGPNHSSTLDPNLRVPSRAHRCQAGTSPTGHQYLERIKQLPTE